MAHARSDDWEGFYVYGKARLMGYDNDSVAGYDIPRARLPPISSMTFLTQSFF